MCFQHQSGSASDSEAMVLNGRQLMTGSSPHLAMLGYHRAVSAPAGTGGAQPALVGVDPGQAPGPPSGFDARPHTISSAYDRYHARSTLSAATFEPPPPPPPSMVHRAPCGPPPMHVHRPPGPPTGRGHRHHCEEVIYQSVLRTPGSSPQLQQMTVNNGTCDTNPGIYLLLSLVCICRQYTNFIIVMYCLVLLRQAFFLDF